MFDNVAEIAKISNINLSDTFCLDAVDHYKDINSYTNTQKINDQAEDALFHSTFVKVYLVLLQYCWLLFSL